MSADRLPRTTEDDAVELRGFIRRYVDNSNSKGVVVGFSGGIDSAVVVKLAADALGPEKVHAVFMPSKATPEADYECTSRRAKEWGRYSPRGRTTGAPARRGATATGMSALQNSASAWRQAPQGRAGARAVPPTMASARKRRRPSETALKSAVRSAQLVRP